MVANNAKKKAERFTVIDQVPRAKAVRQRCGSADDGRNVGRAEASDFSDGSLVELDPFVAAGSAESAHPARRRPSGEPRRAPGDPRAARSDPRRGELRPA